MQIPHVAAAHPAQHQVLVGRHADGAVPVGEGQIGEQAHLGAGEVAQGKGHRHHRVAVLLLGADVRAQPA